MSFSFSGRRKPSELRAHRRIWSVFPFTLCKTLRCSHHPRPLRWHENSSDNPPSLAHEITLPDTPSSRFASPLPIRRDPTRWPAHHLLPVDCDPPRRRRIGAMALARVTASAGVHCVLRLSLTGQGIICTGMGRQIVSVEMLSLRQPRIRPAPPTHRWRSVQSFMSRCLAPAICMLQPTRPCRISRETRRP